MTQPTRGDEPGSDDAASNRSQVSPRFRRRTLHVAVVVAILLVAGFLVWWLRWSVCLIFAAILVGVFFRSGADLIDYYLFPKARRPKVSLTLFCLMVLGLSTLFFWTAVPALAKQVRQLRQDIPTAIEQLEETLAGSRWGGFLVRTGPDGNPRLREVGGVDLHDAASGATTAPSTRPDAEGGASNGGDGTQSTSGGSGTDGDVSAVPGDAGPSPAGPLMDHLVGVFGSALTVVISVVFLFFTGLYLAAEPGLYRRGTLWLVPARSRDRAERALNKIGHTLRWWLAGQFASMSIVGVLSGTGLWILGVPMPLVNGVIAAVLTFIPNFGPVASVLPPALLAFASDGRFVDGPSLALAVVALYLAVQILESYVITPLIQKKAVELPPALLITTQLVMGYLVGLIGVAIAAPLTAAAMAAVRELWVEGDVDHDTPTDHPPEPAGKKRE